MYSNTSSLPSLRTGSTEYYAAPDKRPINDHVQASTVYTAEEVLTHNAPNLILHLCDNCDEAEPDYSLFPNTAPSTNSPKWALFTDSQQVNNRLAIQNHSHSGSPRMQHSATLESAENENTDLDEGGGGDKRDQAAVDKEIEELEAELEIARLEAKLAKLRNAKKSTAPSFLGRGSIDGAEIAVRMGSYESIGSGVFGESVSKGEDDKRSRGDLTPTHDNGHDSIDLGDR